MRARSASAAQCNIYMRDEDANMSREYSRGAQARYFTIFQLSFTRSVYALYAGLRDTGAIAPFFYATPRHAITARQMPAHVA